MTITHDALNLTVPCTPCEQTDACGNITFPQLCWRAVIIKALEEIKVGSSSLSSYQIYRLQKHDFNNGPYITFAQFIPFTARKRSLEQGNIFTSVCQEFCSQGGVWSRGCVETPRDGGMHPTGMHPCSYFSSLPSI